LELDLVYSRSGYFRGAELVVDDIECLLPNTEPLLEIEVTDKLIVLFLEGWLVLEAAVVLATTGEGPLVLVPFEAAVAVELSDHYKNSESVLLHWASILEISSSIRILRYFQLVILLENANILQNFYIIL
jgi:hypothetical protein